MSGPNFEDYYLPRSTTDMPPRRALLNALALLAADLRASARDWSEPELAQARAMVQELSTLLDGPRRRGRAPGGGES